MLKKLMVALTAMMVMMGALLLLASPAGAGVNDGPDIKAVMAFVNKPGTGAIHVLKKDLAGEEPDWAAVQGKTKAIVDCVSNLPKNDPPKGDKEAWQLATKKYIGIAKRLDGAANKKDLEATRKAHGAMLKSCAKCHGEFKG